YRHLEIEHDETRDGFPTEPLQRVRAVHRDGDPEAHRLEQRAQRVAYVAIVVHHEYRVPLHGFSIAAVCAARDAALPATSLVMSRDDHPHRDTGSSRRPTSRCETA